MFDFDEAMFDNCPMLATAWRGQSFSYANRIRYGPGLRDSHLNSNSSTSLVLVSIQADSEVDRDVLPARPNVGFLSEMSGLSVFIGVERSQEF